MPANSRLLLSNPRQTHTERREERVIRDGVNRLSRSGYRRFARCTAASFAHATCRCERDRSSQVRVSQGVGQINSPVLGVVVIVVLLDGHVRQMDERVVDVAYVQHHSSSQVRSFTVRGMGMGREGHVPMSVLYLALQKRAKPCTYWYALSGLYTSQPPQGETSEQQCLKCMWRDREGKGGSLSPVVSDQHVYAQVELLSADQQRILHVSAHIHTHTHIMQGRLHSATQTANATHNPSRECDLEMTYASLSGICAQRLCVLHFLICANLLMMKMPLP